MNIKTNIKIYTIQEQVIFVWRKTLGLGWWYVPDSRAGAFKVTRLAFVKDVLKFERFNCSKESIKVRRVEVLFHYDLAKVVS